MVQSHLGRYLDDEFRQNLGGAFAMTVSLKKTLGKLIPQETKNAEKQLHPENNWRNGAGRGKEP